MAICLKPNQTLADQLLCLYFFLDGDGNLDLLLPICTTEDCSESLVYIYSGGEVGKNTYYQ